MPCREHLSQLRQHQAALDEREIDVAIVTFEADAIARAYVAEHDHAWPLLVDGDRRLYAAYGMDRATWWQVSGPRSIAPYLRRLARGRSFRLPTDDVRQRGGDVLVDPRGRVAMQYVSRTSVDRPSVEAILAAARPPAC